MIKIILASQSKARLKLLRNFGLKVTPKPQRVEESQSLKNGPAKLVVNNAVLKAKSAARKLKTGLVIGADTIVLAGSRLIGKPKDLADAGKTIRLLSRKPHWVYSGIAVIGLDSGKTHTAWDKTKVYMSSLDEAQIKKYCRKFSPLDKAGSFDIQGPGGLLVARIEGCFYNVVGLPLVKLLKILKKSGIDLFSL
ncbi:MAG: septum formation protein Maf [Candidatus Omnitrophica bacterium]|nr:septum formation protein Maf [Candidatus Omnitrophota bacterium]